MRNTTFRYFLYARRSSESEDRQMASIEDQIAEVKKLAERYSLNIVDVISESKSAKEPGRPLFNKMLKRIHKGEADSILTWKLNRLARNPIDGGQISWMLQQNIIKHIQTFERDYNPSDNVLLMQVEFGMANQYVKDLSIDVKRGMRQKAERGWFPISILPIGYCHNSKYRIGIEEEILPDGEQFSILKNLWKLLLTGKYSVINIKKKGDAMGLRNKFNRVISQSTYYYIFSNEFYAGFFYWKDKDGVITRIKGKHKPMVSWANFLTVQNILNRKIYQISRERQYDFPYRGLIKCGECGCMITPDHKLQAICTECKHKFSIKTMTACPKCETPLDKMNNPTILNILYYHCSKSRNNCSQGSIRKEEIESTIEKALTKISLNQDFRLFASTKLKDSEKELEEDKQQIKVLTRKKTTLTNRLNELVNLLADKRINAEQYNLTYINTQKEIYSLETEIENIQNQKIITQEQDEKAFNFCLDAIERFRNGNDLEKTDILQELSSNLTLLNKKLYISIKKPLIDIKKLLIEK
ncbi:recombinase family protein [Niabella aquatica]